MALVIPAHYRMSVYDGYWCIHPVMNEVYRIVDSEGAVISEACPGGGVKINADQAAVSVLLIEAE